MSLPRSLRLTCAAVVALATAHATLVERLSLEQLVDGAQHIVQGRSLRSWSAWDPARQNIWTHHEIEVSDILKGGATRTVVVSEPGGVVDGIGMLVEGMPAYPPGDEMVLFLYQTPIGYWRARGLGQGKFTVLREPKSGRQMVRADLQGAALMEPSGGSAAGVDLRRLDGLALEAFKTQVRALVNRSAGASR